MDLHTLVRGLEEIKRLSRDPLAADRLGQIADRLKDELEREIDRTEPDEESGQGPGLVQPPKDN
jgi:hypothetical protein